MTQPTENYFFTVDRKTIRRDPAISDTSICNKCYASGIRRCVEQGFNYSGMDVTDLSIFFGIQEFPCGLTAKVVDHFMKHQPQPRKEILVVKQTGNTIIEI